jgi:hypothetical protein
VNNVIGHWVILACLEPWSFALVPLLEFNHYDGNALPPLSVAKKSRWQPSSS